MSRKKYIIIFLVAFSVLFLIGNIEATETTFLEPGEHIYQEFYVGNGDIINGSFNTHNEPFLVYVSWFYDGESNSFESLSDNCEFEIYIHGSSDLFEIRLWNYDDVSGYIDYDIKKIGNNYNPPDESETTLELDPSLIGIIIAIILAVTILPVIIIMNLRKERARETIEKQEELRKKEAQPTIHRESDLKFCHSCGAKIKKSLAYCIFCGASQ